MNPIGQREPARWRIAALTLLGASLLSACTNFAFLHPRKVAMEMTQPPEPQVSVPETPEVESTQAPRPAVPPAMNARPRATQMARRNVTPRGAVPPATPASIVPPALTAPTVPQVQPIAPGELVGFSFDSVLEVLRKPDTVEKNALSVVWTYAEADCTLQLYFYPDIQTTVYHLLKYDLKSAKGEKLSDTGACMQPLMAMRKDGAQSQRPAERTDSDRR